jgi:hypothetical protein
MNDIELVIQAEKRLATAHVTMNLAEIDFLLHDDYVILQSEGKIETKREVLFSYITGSRKWTKAEVDQLEVQLYGDTARVIGRWTASGSNNQVVFDYQARFIPIWVKAGEDWKNISYASIQIVS